MKKLVVLLMMAVMATGAMAQIDPDANSMGIYFDTMGEVVCASTGSMGYVVATRCTLPIYAYEARMDIDSTMNGFVNDVAVPAALEGFEIGIGANIVMSFAAPLPAADAVVIGEFTFGNYGGGPAFLTLNPNNADNASIPGKIAVQTGPAATDVIEWGTSTNGGVSAIINGVDCDVVASENVNFGTVKALYR